MGSWEPYTTPTASSGRIRIAKSGRHPLKCPIRNNKDGILRLRGTIGVRICGQVAIRIPTPSLRRWAAPLRHHYPVVRGKSEQVLEPHLRPCGRSDSPKWSLILHICSRFVFQLDVKRDVAVCGGIMRVAVIGTGYVGLVAGACFADTGTLVTCVDIDESKLERLRKGEMPFFEPRLAELVKRNWPQRLEFSSDLAQSIAGREIVFVAVGTPPNEDGSADLSHVLKAAEQIAKAATDDTVLVLKSTVPVGTNEQVTEVIEKHSKFNISVVSNPEFLKEGDAVNDFLKPDRIVIGTDDDRAFEMLSRLYAPYNRQRNRIQRMSPKSAEIVKYASNSLLAVKISFMNEIAQLCDVVGGDAEQVRIAVGSDERIGMQFLYPGLGFGGSCFPKDLRALIHTGEELGIAMDLASAALRANAVPVARMASHIASDLGGLSGKHIAIWGVAFKPKTDDVREAPAIALIQALVAGGATVGATDPQALETARDRLRQLDLLEKVTLHTNEYDACVGADALVVATEWNQYRNPDLPRVHQLMRGRCLYDGRNCLSAESAVESGLVYRGVGRQKRGA